MIKQSIDALRRSGRYAGAAVYRGQDLLFCEGLEPGIISHLKDLFDGIKSRFPSGRASLILQGYTITMLMSGELVIICRYEGRFSVVPALPEEEPEYMAGQAPAGLISREEARKEAAAMLKMLLGQG